MTSVTPSPSATDILRHAVPATEADRLLLFTMRRMAVGGIDDAYAANAMLNFFGRGFRRPLVLLRATMAEVSRVSGRALMIAPCCCPRATADELTLVSAIARTIRDPHGAHDAMSGLLGLHHCHGAVETAHALAESFVDLGHPLGME